MTSGDEVLVEEWLVRLHGPSALRSSEVAALVDGVDAALLDTVELLAESLGRSGARMSVSGPQAGGGSPETS